VSGRILAIGDIHGCDVALRVLLEQLAPTPDDQVIILGDVVDRGPGTRQAVEQLIELRDRCQLVFLRGNHEEMLLDAHAGGDWSKSWLGHGGREALRSYGGRLDQIPREHLDFFNHAGDYYQTETDVFIHANLEPHVPLDKQNGMWLRWTHLTQLERPLPSGQRVICGHTSQKSGLPLQYPGWVCLDTYAHGGKFLTCLEVGPDILYQSTQTGEFRGGLTLQDLAP